MNQLSEPTPDHPCLEPEVHASMGSHRTVPVDPNRVSCACFVPAIIMWKCGVTAAPPTSLDTHEAPAWSIGGPDVHNRI